MIIIHGILRDIFVITSLISNLGFRSKKIKYKNVMLGCTIMLCIYSIISLLRHYGLLFSSTYQTHCNYVPKQILYVGNGTEPQDLDPHIVTGVPESKILMALLEGLVTRNPEGPDPLPGVAQEWDISGDGKTYIFNLRDDAVWSNGDYVTAYDFVYAWNRMLMPSLGSKYPDMLYDLSLIHI